MTLLDILSITDESKNVMVHDTSEELIYQYDGKNSIDDEQVLQKSVKKITTLSDFEDRDWIVYEVEDTFEMANLKACEYDKNVTLDKIREIVDGWQSDTWTDNLSYECMVKIAELVKSQESEDDNG